MPASTFMRVDLPAPFSPTTASTSPARSSSETPSSACTPGNALLSLRTCNRGGVFTALSGRLRRSASESLRRKRRKKSLAGQLVEDALAALPGVDRLGLADEDGDGPLRHHLLDQLADLAAGLDVVR